MGVSLKPSSRKHFRSITLPCRSHPSTNQIDKVLNNVKTWESTSSSSNPSSEIICSGLSQLTELYICLDDLVKTPTAQTSSISSVRSTKWMDEILDVSVKFLDICSNTSDIMLQTKENVRDLGSDLRRKGQSSIETIIAKYVVSRNKLKKDVKGMLSNLKKVDRIICEDVFVTDSRNHHLNSVIRVFREVKALSIVIFRLLVVFLTVPLLKAKQTGRWTGFSRFVSNGKVVPEEKADGNVNELQGLDSVLFRYSECDKHKFIQVIQKKREALDATLEIINSRFELMSRQMIATRTSVLNMVSFY